MTKVINQCPCCGNYTKRGYSCRFCGHLLSPNFLDITYEELQDRNNDLKFLEKKVLERFDFISRYINEGDSVIELGCAEGALLKKIKEQRPTVSLFGVEPSLDSLKARSNEGVAKIFPSLESIPENEKFDLFLCFHVLEHIVDVSGTLEQIKNYIKYNALVVLEVPNFSGHPLVECDNNIEHTHQFTCLSVISLFQKTGYQILSLSTNVFESKAYPDSIRAVAKIKPNRKSLEDDFARRINSTIKRDFYCYGGGGDFKKFVLPFKSKLKFSGILASNPTDAEEFTKYDPKKHSNYSVLISTLRYEKEIFEHLLASGHHPYLIYRLSDFI